MSKLLSIILFLSFSASASTQDEFTIKRFSRRPTIVQTPSKSIDPPINTYLPLTVAYGVENYKQAHDVDYEDQQYDKEKDKQPYYVENDAQQHDVENVKQAYYEEYDERQYDEENNKQAYYEENGDKKYNVDKDKHDLLNNKQAYYVENEEQQYDEENDKHVYYEEKPNNVDKDKQSYNVENDKQVYNVKTDKQTTSDVKNYKQSDEKVLTKSTQKTEKYKANSHDSNSSNNTQIIFPKRTGEIRPVVPILENENYVFAHSGGYHYSYESGDGTRAFEQGALKAEKGDEDVVVGGYSYKDKDGNDFSLSYTAGKNGYRPVGAHLPTPPPIPPAIQRVLRILATKTTPEPVTESLNSY